jgi:hypothetical protein
MIRIKFITNNKTHPNPIQMQNNTNNPAIPVRRKNIKGAQ